MSTCSIEKFLHCSGPCFDVRSPAEYQQAHIPGSISLPLFTDDERAIIGTLYKKKGKKEAIERGVEIVGPKLFSLLQQVKSVVDDREKVPLRIYCWRGGMRSGFVSWFVHFIGYPTLTLQGGYKAWRTYALASFTRLPPFQIIGGFTGSGKTHLLTELAKRGKQVLDLEALASHRGSVYGDVKQKKQPSNEQFENLIAFHLSTMNFSNPIWVEDESRLIGSAVIPSPLFEEMKKASLVIVQCSFEERIERIVQEYGSRPFSWWQECTHKIAKRLGSERASLVLKLIQEGKHSHAVSLLLEYYDKAYTHAMSRRQGPITYSTYEAILGGEL